MAFDSLRLIWRILDHGMRRRLMVMPVFLLIGGLLEGVSVGLFLPLLQIIAAPDDIGTLPWISDIYRTSGIAAAPTFLLMLSGVILAIFIVKNAFALYLTYFQQDFIWRSRSIMAETLLRHYMDEPYVFHLRHNSAILLRNITQSIQEIFVGIVLPLVTIATDAVIILAICALLVGVDLKVTLIVCAILGATMVIYYALVRQPLKRWGVMTQETNRSIIQHVQQMLNCIREIKVSGRETYFADLFAREIAINSSSRLRYQLVSQLSRHLIEIAAVCILCATLVVVVLSGRPLADAVPTLGLFAVAAFRTMPSLNRIAGQLQNIRFGSAALDVLRTDLANVRPRSVPDAPVVPMAFRETLQLDDISFRYPDTDVDIVRNVSLTIRRGESIGIVGASGAGKSSLAAIVMGLLTPSSGTIRVDGIELSAANLTAWRRLLGFIPQDVAIMDDTLRGNIAFGLPSDRVEDRRLVEATRHAALEDFVAGLPQGFDTMLGERGTRLSGGQRQRVGIARALYQDADILLLDEATSALDAETEARISDAIKRLHGVKTLLIIAHRLSTVQNCDRLCFMDAGRIVDIGTFGELKARNSSFRSMVEKIALEETA